MPDEFNSLLPNYTTPRERAIEQVSGERMDASDVDVIRRYKDPWQCPAHLLWALAAERSVDIWKEDWPEWKKRSVIAAAPEDHALKTAAEGIARYIAHADGELVEVLTPPQGIVLAPSLTKAQWDAWIARMPKLRITIAHGRAEWTPPLGIYLDFSALDDDCLSINQGPFLRGRRAKLRMPGAGEDIPLQVASIETTVTQRTVTDHERAVVPGLHANAVILNVGALDDAILDAIDVRPKVFTWSLDRSYDHVASALSLSMVPVGFDPLDVRYRRESDIADLDGKLALDDGALDADVLPWNASGELLADVLYLHDPDVPLPAAEAYSFLDVSRLGMPAYHAELMIRTMKKAQFGFFLGDGMLGLEPLIPNDVAHLDFIMDAIESAQALGEKIRVTFETTKPLTLGDAPRLDSGLSLGDRVPAHL